MGSAQSKIAGRRAKLECGARAVSEGIVRYAFQRYFRRFGFCVTNSFVGSQKHILGGIVLRYALCVTFIFVGGVPRI